MRRVGWLLFLVLVLALTGYYQPWYIHDSAAFTMHAYDLAEWASLHPAVRSEAPPMLTSFLLRWPLVAWVFMMGFTANQVTDTRWRWLVRLAGLLIVFHFVPPFDFLSAARNDPTYRQMALLVVLGVGGMFGTLALSRVSWRWQAGVALGVCLSGMGAAWWGMTRTDPLLANFQIDVRWGPGLGMYLGAMTFIALSLCRDLIGAVGAVAMGRRPASRSA